MSTGPLRRGVGALGLLALIPVAVQLVTGAIEPEVAALRAIVIGVVVTVLGRVASRVVTGTLRRFERQGPTVATGEPVERSAEA